MGGVRDKVRRFVVFLVVFVVAFLFLFPLVNNIVDVVVANDFCTSKIGVVNSYRVGFFSGIEPGFFRCCKEAYNENHVREDVCKVFKESEN